MVVVVVGEGGGGGVGWGRGGGCYSRLGTYSNKYGNPVGRYHMY